VGARTDAARAEVLAARGALIDEVQGLEASARAAADIPAKVRRNPVRTVGAAGGAAFLLLGGPQRIYRQARRVVLGPKADLPKTMLPKEIDQTLRQLGDDGDRVRATVEKEFAKYLRERAKLVTDSDAKATAVSILALALKPVASQVGKQLAKQVIAPDREGFDTALNRIRSGRAGMARGSAAQPPASAPPSSAPSSGTAAGSGTAAARAKSGTAKP
jgi:hypothetical protein